ncbi:MAG TPA: DUF177 domain-containing protein [Longimicrobiales bacterium]|nr:DUF177 domain-containing protein [Longimicrobiales bacterium]
MLKADIGLLAREHRIRVEEDLSPDDPVWDGTGLTFAGPVRVELELQQVVGGDVVVRGHVRGGVELSCRRCMKPVVLDLEDELTFVFRPGLSVVEAEAAELYTLPERAKELDLAVPLREHVVLAVPEYVNCSETCRGFCPQCGTDLNESSCDCTVEDEDPRWAALRRLRSE